jgi:lipopolysaccharide export system protein LptA
MEYYASPERIVLIERAIASQGGDEFRSDRIVYDIEKDIVNAGTGEGDSRVHITLQPRNNDEGTSQQRGKESRSESP